MTAGLPGSGIGGFFYLIASFAIPLREIWLVARGDIDRARMRLAWRQFAVAVGIVTVVWMSGVLVNRLLPFSGGEAGTAQAGLPGTTGAVSLLIALGILSGVLLLVEVLALLERRRSIRARRRARRNDGLAEPGHNPAAEPWSGADGTAPV